MKPSLKPAPQPSPKKPPLVASHNDNKNTNDTRTASDSDNFWEAALAEGARGSNAFFDDAGGGSSRLDPLPSDIATTKRKHHHQQHEQLFLCSLLCVGGEVADEELKESWRGQ